LLLLKKKYTAKSTAILTEKQPQLKPEPRQLDPPKAKVSDVENNF
jgi:hypothetical protein